MSWPGARNADEEQRQNGTSTGAGQAGNETRLRSLQGHYDRGKKTQEEVDRGSLEEERESDLTRREETSKSRAGFKLLAKAS